MINWLLQNWGTLAVCIVLAGILGFVIAAMIRDKKKGKSTCGCGGGCSACPMGGTCHSKQ